jgi:competence protein ComGC
MKPNGEKSTGFTLVELVVVAGIVAILFAVFLPGRLRADRPTKGTKCLSNIKQLGLASMLYSQDNNDHLPNANGPAGPGVFFAGLLAPYLGVTFDRSRGMDQAYIADVCRQAPVFRCPAWPQRSGEDKDIGLHYTINGIKYESRSEPAATGAARSLDLKLSNLPVSLNQIALFLELSAHRKFTNYSECVVIDASTSTFDKNGKRNSQANARMIWGGDKRHLGKSTLAFIDGHGEVRPLTKEEMGFKRLFNPLDKQARY